MGSVDFTMVKRNFKQNPITDAEILYCRWYPVVDSLIGGWAISNVNQTTAELNPYEGTFEFGSFMSEAEARHIAFVHNAWWDSIVAMSYLDNLGSYFVTYCNNAELTRTH